MGGTKKIQTSWIKKPLYLNIDSKKAHHFIWGQNEVTSLNLSKCLNHELAQLELFLATRGSMSSL